MLRRLTSLLGLIFACASAPVAAAGPADVQTTWQLLDYLAVDYGGAVRDGKVVSASEYSEMREFSASAADKIAGLPANPAKAQLVAESKRFKALIEAKASLADVATAAHALGQHLLAAYPVPLGPGTSRTSPEASACSRRLAPAATAPRATRKPPMARQLKPPPIAFADRDARELRSRSHCTR